ncbi:unnamed protein product [Symbiodinium pilosum]|uniref:Uncharacterized protein n=1 Tax=Symbiodinium pilosum TaxID=2952 RepID=A0A812P707_SYMPI|nr:unnamed protein product [Symbiodinium pilosum]
MPTAPQPGVLGIRADPTTAEEASRVPDEPHAPLQDHILQVEASPGIQCQSVDGTTSNVAADLAVTNTLVPAWGCNEDAEILHKPEHGSGTISDNAIDVSIADGSMPPLPPMPAWDLHAARTGVSPAAGPSATSLPSLEGIVPAPTLTGKNRPNKARLQKKRSQSSRKPGLSKDAEP